MNRQRPLTSYLIPSIADLFFVVIFLYLCFRTDSALLGDGDTGYHIRTGHYILDTLSIPKYDLFSFHSPPLPWTAHEWLSEVVMAALHGLFGMNGVVIFFSFLLALTTYLLFKILRSYQAGIIIAIAVTVLVETASQVHWLARPHVFSFLFMILFHYLLESWHRGRMSRLYLLPPMMLLWVNLHGGFVGGFILIGAYLVGIGAGILTGAAASRLDAVAKTKQLAMVAAACVAACLLNPQGYRILLFPFKLVSDSFIMDNISEFLSPDFHKMAPFKYLLLLLIGILALSRKKMEATELVLVLVFTNMALYSSRYIPLFGLITAPILTRNSNGAEVMSGRFGAFVARRAEGVAAMDASAAGFLWPALAVIIVVAGLPFTGIQHSFDARKKPVAACEFLMRENISGNMYNDDEFGDYIIYRSHPGYRVFFDGRADMYGAAKLRDYQKVAFFQNGWEQVLEKYRITWIIFGSGTPLARYLIRDTSWKLIYSDGVADIFVKDLPEHRRLIEKYRDVKPVQPATEM